MNLAGRRDKQAEHRGFYNSKTIPHDTVMVETCHYLFVQTHGMYTTRVNPIINYGLHVVMMCRCRFIKCNKYSILVRDVHNGGGYMCVKAEGSICTFLSIFL